MFATCPTALALLRAADRCSEQPYLERDLRRAERRSTRFYEQIMGWGSDHYLTPEDQTRFARQAALRFRRLTVARLFLTDTQPMPKGF